MTAERPDAPPDAYTCEWCPEDAAATADGFSYDAADPSGPWIPTCDECREASHREGLRQLDDVADGIA